MSFLERDLGFATIVVLLALAGVGVLAASSLPYLPLIHGSTADEVERLAAWLDVQPGTRVADLGAAQGARRPLCPPARALGTRLGAMTPPPLGRAAITLLLSAACTGCGSWTGFGFRADGPEMPRLRQVLAVEAGKVVADVGAGKGELTVALAREVRPNGRVLSTEINATRLKDLREAVVDARLDNVSVVDARSHETGLPPNCCDAIVLRRVYHHLTDPSSINASLLRALRPGGVLAVIDFPPPFFWSRGSLGVPAKVVVNEVAGSGFEPLRLIEDWPGRGPFQSYCAVFRKPLAGPRVH